LLGNRDSRLDVYLKPEELLTRAQSLGGGCITTADCATYVILSHAGSVGGSALSPGEEQLVNMVEHDPSRAALSQEWVNDCIRAEKLVDLEPYRIVAGSVGAMSSGGTTATIGRLTRPIRQPESLGVTRGVHGVGFDGIAEEVEAPKVKATNRARHDEEAKAHYQHFEEDEETWDDPMSGNQGVRSDVVPRSVLVSVTDQLRRFSKNSRQ
jgi:hypothetical protein